MSRYELLRIELAKLRTRQAFAIFVPTAATAVVLVQAMDAGDVSVLAGLATFVVLPFVLHRVWLFAFPAYRAWTDRSSQISTEITVLQMRIARVFDTYRERNKGERFKEAYDLTGRTVRDLEEALSVGMYRERREVFVTAFFRDGIAIRVTASIGSPLRCSAADNPGRWSHHIERLRCDAIRQYHNHPDHNGSTRPSLTDINTCRSLKALLGPHSDKLCSLIICWNNAREWKVFEYDEGGQHWLHFEFDASV